MARTHHPPMERTITFETRQFSVYVDRLDGNKRAEACCAQSFVIEQHDPSARPSPRDTASIASAIHELRSRCPHIEPPRFPPVVRRLHGALLGQKDTGVSSEGRESEGNNGKRRRCPDKHTLTTRHVVHERNVLALEVTKGRKRVYKKMQSSDKDKKPVDGCPGSFDMVQGYPESVSGQYTEYMSWRGMQYFFGGALSVYTTKALLSAVGLKRGAGASAAAINWVVKDGAGRLGRFLFARWGHQLDCELKQFRLLGDGLMEIGACLELSTIRYPNQFLLLACSANLLKNLAAVAASSTRAPIYRSFALQNNLADVTAKGESVANLSDILGVSFGIGISRFNWPIGINFLLLSTGYLIASRKEVDSVILPYMNQARLAYSMDIFLKEKRVPGIREGNIKEPLIPLGKRWNGYGQVVLGASVETACESPEHLAATISTFGAPSTYYLSYRPDKDKVYVMLKEGIEISAALEATVMAHSWLHRIHEVVPEAERACMAALPATGGSDSDAQRTLAYIRGKRRETWGEFRDSALTQGWNLKGSMLAMGDTRLLALP